MGVTNQIFLVVTIITCAKSFDQNIDNFVTINGQSYDIIQSEKHVHLPTENITTYTIQPLSNVSLTSPNSDAFVDLILAGARKLIKDQGLDPADLPNAIAKFSKKILGIKVWGEAKVRILSL